MYGLWGRCYVFESGVRVEEDVEWGGRGGEGL